MLSWTMFPTPFYSLRRTTGAERIGRASVIRSHWKSASAYIDHFLLPRTVPPFWGVDLPQEVGGLGPHRGLSWVRRASASKSRHRGPRAIRRADAYPPDISKVQSLDLAPVAARLPNLGAASISLAIRISARTMIAGNRHG
jgi:hypothetical protein